MKTIGLFLILETFIIILNVGLKIGLTGVDNLLIFIVLLSGSLLIIYVNRKDSDFSEPPSE